MGGSVKRWFAAAAASIMVLGISLLAGSCANPLNWALQVWGMVDLVTVKGGTLNLGDVEGELMYPDQSPIHSTSVATFQMSRYEITQDLYYQVMGVNPSLFQFAYGYDDDWSRPVETVSWQAAIIFCNELSDLAGLTPCYFIDDSNDTVTWYWNANGYRLPTEAEWEFAARGGKFSGGYEFAGSPVLNDVSWNGNNEGLITHPVGQKQPNELDLYDMAGNVFEWCWDGYDWTDISLIYHSGTYYLENTDWNNPLGPWGTVSKINSTYLFVARGGSIYAPEEGCRNAFRGFAGDTFSSESVGFRVVRSQ